MLIAGYRLRYRNRYDIQPSPSPDSKLSGACVTINLYTHAINSNEFEFDFVLQAIRGCESSRSYSICNTKQYLLYTNVLRMDVTTITVEETISSAVLENGRIIFPLAVGDGNYVELDCWI